MNEGDEGGPRTVHAAKRVAARVRTAYHRSRLRRASARVSTRYDDLSSRAASAYASSRLGRTVARAWRVVRSARLYRWLASEPDPVTVVVDLRETRTVGPVLGLLDRTVATAASARASATSAALANDLHREVASRPVHAASLVALVAVATTLVVRSATGTLSQHGLGIGLVLFGLALAGTRSRWSWPELRDSRPCRTLAALVTPPDTPETGRQDSPGTGDDGD